MRLLYGLSEEVAEFVASLLPGFARGFGNCKAIGVLDGDTLVAGVVFHNWNPEAGVIEISGASVTPKWMTRNVVAGLFEYAFDQIGCQLVIARVAERNRHVQRGFRRFGFAEVFVARMRGRNEGELIFTFTDDAWRESRFRKRGSNGRTKTS